MDRLKKKETSFISRSLTNGLKAIHNGLQSIMNFPKESRLPEEYREPCSPNSRLLSYSCPEKRVYSLGERFVEVVPTRREKLVTLIQSSMKDFVPARQRWINFEYRSISDSLLVHQNHQATSCMGSVVLTPESCCSKTETAEEESWQSKLAEYVEPIRFPSWILAQAARVNRTLRNKSTHVSLLSSSGERVSKRKLNINVDTQDEEQKPTLYRDENQYEMNRRNGEENSGLYKDETEKITTELDLGTVCLPRTTKKRPRPRLSSFQSDKKMWMMSKAATSESEEPQVPQTQSEQPRQAKSNKDVIISAFGFDPTVDPFSRYKRSSVALPSSLASLQLPTLNRSDVCFFRDDEDEFIVYKSGASTTLFKAVYNVTNVLVKDVFRSHGQQILIEAKILYMLNNTGLTPNVHGVIRQGIVEEEFSVVMQHLDGYLSLTEILLSGLFVSRRSWCSIVKTLASHLHVLHEHRVIHNNLNQEHVLVNPDTLDVKVVGSGNASFLQGRKLDVSGLANNNMAPEMQFGCVSSPHSDVFAFGNIVQAVMNESKVMSLYNVVQACLQKLPRDRPLTETILSIVTTL